MLRFPSAPALFLDFDGCLVDLAPTPDAVRVPSDLLPLLVRLKRALGGAVAIVSGRPSWDLHQFIGAADLHMVGSHGAETMQGRGTIQAFPVDQVQLAHIEEEAERILGDKDGLILERKPVAVGLHYRGAPEEEGRIQAAAQDLAAESDGFHLHQSKMAVEIRPDGIGKGGAVERLMGQDPFRGRTPVMFGDEETDEPAFVVAQRMGGFGVKVGPGPTAARHRLGDPAQVRATLAHLVERMEAHT